MGGRCREGTTTPASAPSSASSKQRKGGVAAGRMPSNAEIEEFFTAVESGHVQLLKDRYNYDFERDEPMEGRYEWVELQADDDGGGN